MRNLNEPSVTLAWPESATWSVKNPNAATAADLAKVSGIFRLFSRQFSQLSRSLPLSNDRLREIFVPLEGFLRERFRETSEKRAQRGQAVSNGAGN